MKYLKLIDQSLYVTNAWLIKQGISINTIESWDKNGFSAKIKAGRFIYRKFSEIPSPTKLKLPSEEDIISSGISENALTDADIFAQYLEECVKNSAKYVKLYLKEGGVTQDKAKAYAKRRALLEGIMTIYNDYSVSSRLQKGMLEPIAQAYRTVAKSKTNDIEFSRIIGKCKKFGFDYIILDNRKGGNNKAYGDEYDYMLASLVSGANNLGTTQAARELIKMCKKQGLRVPSLSWSDKKAREIESNIDVYCAKYGLTKTKKITPYAKIIAATYADDQYQIDGYNLPFFCRVYDENGKSRIDRLVLVAVKDAHSGKIIGYSIDESEDRYSLYDAIQDAFSNNGGYLPYEIVTDNHSYNLTEMVENFKHNADLLGMVWTVDSNPQRKAKVERGFKMLAENHLKNCYGYLGQGILTKHKNGRVSQEMVERYYSKQVMSVEEVKLVVASAILEFNDTPYEGQTLSPNQLYAECTKPHRIELDIYDRVRLFTPCKEYKVIRGQINIEHKGTIYEYQLNAQQMHKYNNKKVTVRYEDFDTIYLFDKKTERAIGAIRQKQGIHGAIANQTEADLDALNKVEGRRKGYLAAARKELEDLRDRAEAIRPGITHMVESYMMPKNIKKELENNVMLQQQAERMGINTDTIPFVEHESHLTLASLKPKVKKERQPFAPKNHTIGIINLDDE